jgi:hypothetical protein
MVGSDLGRMRGRKSLRRKPATVEKGWSGRKFFWNKKKGKDRDGG